MKTRTQKLDGPRKALLATACLLLAAGLAAAAEDAGPTAAPPQTIDPDLLLALVAEVKSLRIELLEHRLESYDERITLLEQGLEHVALERSAIENKHQTLDAEVDEIEFSLQDPDLDNGQRAYLEATREELDWQRSRTLDHETETLDEQEHDLKVRFRDLQKTRKRIALYIQGLTGN